MSFITKGGPKEEEDSWLDLVTSSQRACEWCSGTDGREEFSKLSSEPWTAWPPQLLQDLLFCFDCVLEYHRIQDEFVEEKLCCLKELQKADTERLCGSLEHSLQGAVKKEHDDVKIENFELTNWTHQLHVPMLEILCFPKLLFSKTLACLFVRAVITLDLQACPLAVEEKLPGVYLLLVHPEKQVRRWASRCVQKLGPVDVECYENLREVISLLIKVLELNLFENSDLVGSDAFPDLLPPHLFISDSVTDFWHGISMLVFHLKVETICRKFMDPSDSNTSLLKTTVNTIKYSVEKEGSSPFWPALQCLLILIERLGSKIWIQLNPSETFLTITEHPSYKAEILKWNGYQDGGTSCRTQITSVDSDDGHVSSSQDDKMPSTNAGRSLSSTQPYKTSLAWFFPFVQSLLDFGEAYEDCVSQVIYHAHSLSDKSVNSSALWMRAEEIIVRTVHEVLSKEMPSLVKAVAHVWVPHVVTLSVHEQANQKSVLPLVLTSRQVTVMLLRQIRKTQKSSNILKFMSYFGYSFDKSLVLTVEQKRQLTEILQAHFETNAGKMVTRSKSALLYEKRKTTQKKRLSLRTRKTAAKLKFENPEPSNRRTSDSTPRTVLGHAPEGKLLEAAIPLVDIRKYLKTRTTTENRKQTQEVSKSYEKHGAVATDAIVISDDDDDEVDTTKHENAQACKHNCSAVAPFPEKRKNNAAVKGRSLKRKRRVICDEDGDTDDPDVVPLNSLLKKDAPLSDPDSLVLLSGSSDKMKASNENTNTAATQEQESELLTENTLAALGDHQRKDVQDWCEGVGSSNESVASTCDDRGCLQRMKLEVACVVSLSSDEDIAAALDRTEQVQEFHDVKVQEYEKGEVLTDEIALGEIVADLVEETLPAPDETLPTLDAISKQVENPGLNDVEMSYWADDDFNNNLLWNSQEVVIEEELIGNLHSPSVETDEDAPGLFERLRAMESQKDCESGDQQQESRESSGSSVLREGGNAAPLTSLPPAVAEPKKTITVDDFLGEVLCWKTAWLNETDCGHPEISRLESRPVPLSFDDMDYYYDVFKPLLLLETWQQIVNDWSDPQKSKKEMTATMESTSWLPGNFVMIRCCGAIGSDQATQSRHPLESDLVVVSYTTKGVALPPDHPCYPCPVFGVVEAIEKCPIRGNRSASDTGASRDRSHRLSLTIKTHSAFRPQENSSLRIECVTSLLSTLRQWCGLLSIRKSRLAADILRPRRVEYFGVKDFVEDVVVSKEYNLSQERVLCTVAEAVHQPYPIPRICLVQGPPGTGKSHTISGLIARIFNHRKSSHSQGGGALGRTRVLVCAPSNAAVDELIRKIVKGAPRLNDKSSNVTAGNKPMKYLRNCGDFGLVRVGRKSHIHADVAKWSLDNLVKARVTQSESEEGVVTQLRDQIKEVEKMLDLRERQSYQNKAATGDKQAGIAQDDKEGLLKKKRELEFKFGREKSKMEDRRRQETRMRREILNTADILCCTLNGSGTKTLARDLGGLASGQMPFTCVIVDEACQSCELDILIPLQLGSSKLVLVGDPEQLPTTVLSRKAKEMMFGRSMFERFYRFFRTLKKERNIERPVMMLDVQYRMHPEISRFPAEHVYSRRLLNDSSLEHRPFPLKIPYAFFDVVGGREICEERGSLWNPVEAQLVADLVAELITKKVLPGKSVGIITPYRRQQGQLQSLLRERTHANIEVNTVDGFQGREKDVIILSCVRARGITGSIGFLANPQRMNVALTRARHALYIFGHCKTLETNRDWMALIQDAKNRNLLFPVKTFSDFQEFVLGRVTSAGPCDENIREPLRETLNDRVPKRVTFNVPHLETASVDEHVATKNASAGIKRKLSKPSGEALWSRGNCSGEVVEDLGWKGGQSNSKESVSNTRGKSTDSLRESEFTVTVPCYDSSISSGDFGDEFDFDFDSLDEDDVLKVNNGWSKINTCQSPKIDSTSEASVALSDGVAETIHRSRVEYGEVSTSDVSTDQDRDGTSNERLLRANFSLDAQAVVDRIKARHPPALGPQVIPATKDLINKKWKPHGGPRERRAQVKNHHVEGTRWRGSASTSNDVPSYQAKKKRLSYFRAKFSQNR